MIKSFFRNKDHEVSLGGIPMGHSPNYLSIRHCRAIFIMKIAYLCSANIP